MAVSAIALGGFTGLTGGVNLGGAAWLAAKAIGIGLLAALQITGGGGGGYGRAGGGRGSFVSGSKGSSHHGNGGGGVGVHHGYSGKGSGGGGVSHHGFRGGGYDTGGGGSSYTSEGGGHRSGGSVGHLGNGGGGGSAYGGSVGGGGGGDEGHHGGEGYQSNEIYRRRRRRQTKEKEDERKELEALRRVLDLIRRQDVVGCGMKLVCELASLREEELDEEQRAVLNLVGSTVKPGEGFLPPGGAGDYTAAKILGEDLGDCSVNYPLCPVNGTILMKMVSYYLTETL